MTVITHLNLCFNELGAQGGKALAGALGSTTTIQTLDLQRNNFGVEGVEALLPALFGWPSITCFYVDAEPDSLDWSRTGPDRPPDEVLAGGWAETLKHIREAPCRAAWAASLSKVQAKLRQAKTEPMGDEVDKDGSKFSQDGVSSSKKDFLREGGVGSSSKKELKAEPQGDDVDMDGSIFAQGGASSSSKKRRMEDWLDEDDD